MSDMIKCADCGASVVKAETYYSRRGEAICSSCHVMEADIGDLTPKYEWRFSILFGVMYGPVPVGMIVLLPLILSWRC